MHQLTIGPRLLGGSLRTTFFQSPSFLFFLSIDLFFFTIEAFKHFDFLFSQLRISAQLCSFFKKNLHSNHALSALGGYGNCGLYIVCHSSFAFTCNLKNSISHVFQTFLFSMVLYGKVELDAFVYMYFFFFTSVIRASYG